MGAKINFPYGMPGGIAIRGIPVVNTVPGNTYFVHSGTGSSANSGKKQSKPLATVTQALAKCTDSKGDVIFVLPGHAETLSSASAIVCNKIGVQIVGLGSGTLRPTFTFSNTAATIDVTVANVGIYNCIFTCAIDSLVTGFSVTAAGCVFRGNTFNYTSTNDALIWITTNASADDFVFSDNYCIGDHAGPTEVLRLVGVDRGIISDNVIRGSYSTAVINAITTACTNILISNNRLANSVTDAKVIAMVASSTGGIEFNRGSVVSTAGITDANIISAANCQLTENYFSDANGETGKLVGVVSA